MKWWVNHWTTCVWARDSDRVQASQLAPPTGSFGSAGAKPANPTCKPALFVPGMKWGQWVSSNLGGEDTYVMCIAILHLCFMCIFRGLMIIIPVWIGDRQSAHQSPLLWRIVKPSTGELNFPCSANQSSHLRVKFNMLKGYAKIGQANIQQLSGGRTSIISHFSVTLSSQSLDWDLSEIEASWNHQATP